MIDSYLVLSLPFQPSARLPDPGDMYELDIDYEYLALLCLNYGIFPAWRFCESL